MKRRVVVGMSGGVDSSVAALLLKEQGYEVIGITLDIWRNPVEGNRQCCGLQAAEDAAKVARLLSIPHYVWNFQEIFQREVISYFTHAYQRGETPNPCVVCNRRIKWEALLDRARALGADFLATGHYARVVQLENGRYTLSSGGKKDQTYALCLLSQDQLTHTLLPLGNREKNEVREIARKAALPVAEKPDSQEICFVPDGDYAGFIERERKEKDVPGSFVDPKGRVLGTHRGITHYTVGQRKRLGLSLGRPGYVTEILPESNQVVVGEEKDLFTTTVAARCCNFMSREAPFGPIPVVAKIRYNHAGARAMAQTVGDGMLLCRFEQPVRAVAPGQFLVLYEGDQLLAGGVIMKQGEAEKISMLVS